MGKVQKVAAVLTWPEVGSMNSRPFLIRWLAVVLLAIVALCDVSFAQVRVRGYTRKDGTCEHKRHNEAVRRAADRANLLGAGNIDPVLLEFPEGPTGEANFKKLLAQISAEAHGLNRKYRLGAVEFWNPTD